MALTPGARIGSYEVVAQIGVGGMGEVYRATDTNLGRPVAIKVLPEAFAQDAERLARFEREAKTLASLNHPNVAQIYGFEKWSGVHALVMELVEGPTLADRIAEGPIPIDDALSIGKQIADGLEAAHEQGIVHRDLKPANVKVRPDGAVKVLDFGLAKALEPADGMSMGASMSPTITTPAMTQIGIILGTAAYMSPEQAKGRPADRRSDIWAFGVVLYELLTGRRAFEGDDVSDTLASVLKSEPDWSVLPADVPPAIRTLMQRCLVKDRRHRVADIAVAQFVLAEASALVPAGTSGSKEQDPLHVQREVEAAVARARRELMWRRVIPVAALVMATMFGLGGWILRPTTRPPSVFRFSLSLPEGQTFTATGRRAIAISPDGRQLVYAAIRGLYVRSLSEFQPRVIPGSEAHQTLNSPVFSPDGAAVAFFSDGFLKQLAVGGGAATTICPASALPYGLAWDSSGLVFGQAGMGIFRCSANGGSPERVATVNEGEIAHGPQMLPGGEAMLFTVAKASDGSDRWERAQVVVQSLTSGTRKTLIEGGSDARYYAGHLLYAFGGDVFAVRFDLAQLAVVGGRVPGTARCEKVP